MSYKKWLFVATLLFGIGLSLGLATPAGVASLAPEDIAALEDVANLLASLSPLSVLTLILIKNLSVILISVVLSPMFCLIPVAALIVNGWLLGLVATTVMQEKSLGYLLAGLLPHGVFELPALIMGEAVAFSFGTAVLRAFFRKGGENLPLSNLRQNFRYFMVALLLLLPAAIIETFITPLFLI